MNEFAERIAVKYRLENHLYTLPLRFEDICELIRKEKYDIISYDEIRELDSPAIFAFATYGQQDAYTITDGENRIVCYNNHLPYEERNFALAHELGHIILRHTSAGIRGKSNYHPTPWYAEDEDKDAQEQEADNFALGLLAPSCVLGFIFPDNFPPKGELSRLSMIPSRYIDDAYSYAASLRFSGRSKLGADEQKLLYHYCIDQGIEPYEKMIDPNKKQSFLSTPVGRLITSCFSLAAGIAMILYAIITL